MTAKSDVWLMWLSVALAVLAVIAYAFLPNMVHELAREDAVLESLSALFFFVSSALLFWAAFAKYRRNIWIWGLAALFFVVAGEEISWGQRILGIATPTDVASVNVQGEMNLHNHEALHGIIRAMALLFIWGLFIAIPVATLNSTTARWIDYFSLPVAPWSAAVMILIATAFMVVPRLHGEIIFTLDEIGEAFISLAALTLSIHIWLDAARKQGSAVFSVQNER